MISNYTAAYHDTWDHSSKKLMIWLPKCTQLSWHVSIGHIGGINKLLYCMVKSMPCMFLLTKSPHIRCFQLPVVDQRQCVMYRPDLHPFSIVTKYLVPSLGNYRAGDS